MRRQRFRVLACAWVPRGLLLGLALATVPLHASAHRTALPSDAPTELTAPAGDELAASTSAAPGVGAGARARRLPPPPPPGGGLSSAELRRTLATTRADLEQCLAASALPGSLRVTVRVATSHALSVAVVAPRHDVAASRCAELVVRRALTQLAAEPITHAVSASLSVRRRTPRPPPPAPPPTGELSGFEAPVHAAIERDRSAMISCLSSAAPGTTGEATLRMTLGPDGSLTLASASLPSGVPAGPALPCLASRIANLRFSPAPPREMSVTHTLPLGL